MAAETGTVQSVRSEYFSKMSSKVTIQDLPDEMLEKILLYLSWEGRKRALRVCKRWSALKLFALSSVQLVIDSERFHSLDYQDYHRALLASSRQYKHICFGGYFEQFEKEYYVMDLYQELLVTKDDSSPPYKRKSFGESFERYDLLVDIFTHFSRSVESLNISLTGYKQPTSLILFAKIAAQSSNLKHLHIFGEFESSRGDLKLSTMNNLEGLYLYNNHQMLMSIPHLQDITPNITRLTMNIKSKDALNFLRHFSPQLVELRCTIPTNFLTVCPMQFPLLEKATIYFVDTGDSHEESDRHGLKGIPLLCQSIENIQSLYLSLKYMWEFTLDPDSLRAICKLKHLKSLRLYNTKISVPSELDFSPLESLHELSLDAVRINDQIEFNRFCQHAFPRLAVLEMIGMQPEPLFRALKRDLSLKLYDNVCGNMPSLKRLEIIQSDGNLQLSPFLEFCASRAPRELKIKCGKVYDPYRQDEFRPIPVETLIMDVSEISLKLLQKLIKSMGALKRLDLTIWLTHLLGLNLDTQLERFQRLRAAFPRCKIVITYMLL